MSDTAIETGVITERIGNQAKVRIINSGSCKSCGAKLICNPGAEDSREMLAANPLDAQVGDHVRIEEIDNVLLIISLAQFGLPLIGLIFGVLGINALTDPFPPLPKEAVVGLGGLVGLLLGGIGGRLWLQKIVKHRTAFFKITARLGQEL